MLARIEAFNRKAFEKNKELEEGDWRDHWQLTGSDVVSLFPSLSAVRTAKVIRDIILILIFSCIVMHCNSFSQLTPIRYFQIDM